MTSFKKPLIAIAVALALTTTAFASAPANAAVATTTTINNVATATDGLTTANAVVLPVPADNSVDVTDVVRIAVTGVDNNVAVTAVASGALLTSKVTSGDARVYATSGTASATVNTGTGTTATFYAYTTSTTVGTVTVTVGTAIPVVYYVKGTAGALNAVAVTAPTAALGTTAKVTATGTDVFGNPVAGAVVAIQVISANDTNTYSVTTDVKGLAVKDLSGLAVGTYDVVATATVATAIDGLTKPVGFVKAQFKVTDLVAQIADLQAQLAASQAQTAKAIADAKVAFDAVTTKAAADLAAQIAADNAAYNALATKWNKKHPKSKVALRK